MRTIYIKGRKKYKKNIRKGLDKSKLIEGYDFIEGLGGNDHVLMWIREDLDLRDFKLAISAKYVWKNRLRFYKSIDEMKPKRIDDGFSSSEISLMNEMKNRTFDRLTI